MADVKVKITLTIDTEEFASGDLMGQATEVEDVCLNNQAALIRSVLLLDHGAQGSELDLLLFKDDPGSLGTLNEPPVVSEAQADLLFGAIHVHAGDYVEMGNKHLALTQAGMLLIPADGTSIWVAPVSRFPAKYPGGELDVTFYVIQPAQE